ncbi:MAG: hypothetical protein IPJ30_13030 [Acidobacteria bacterium]|nr:hypothetical protein [Acidobacteriota bacterium]
MDKKLEFLYLSERSTKEKKASNNRTTRDDQEVVLSFDDEETTTRRLGRFGLLQHFESVGIRLSLAYIQFR